MAAAKRKVNKRDDERMNTREGGLSWLARIAPRWAYRRECYRRGVRELRSMRDGLDGMRNYDAARPDRLNASWRVTNAPPNMTDSAYRDLLRARARDLERNSDLFNSMIQAYLRGVVGWGLQLQPNTGDAELDARLGALFERWRRARNCDAQGALTFDEMCAQIVRRKLVDGGVLIVKSYGGSTVPLQLQLLEVDMLAGTVTAPHERGNTVVAGVELTPAGRTVGYWITPRTPDELERSAPVFIPEKDCIFYRASTRPGQVREMPAAAAAMARLRDVEGYIEAQSVKERVAACFAAFIKRSTPPVGVGMGLARRNRDGAPEYQGSTITPGMIAHLGLDEDVSFAQPPSAGSEATSFTRLLTRMTAASLGLSYEVASRDMSQVTYSSARQGLIEDEMTYRMEQQSLTDHVLTEVYESFVISAVVSGRVDIPDFWARKQDYLRCDWIPQGRQWIDPQKEANANATALQFGLKPFAEIAGASGYDWRRMMDQLKAEQDYAQAIGLKLPWSAGQVDAAAATVGDSSAGGAAGDEGGGEIDGSNEEGGQ